MGWWGYSGRASGHHTHIYSYCQTTICCDQCENEHLALPSQSLWRALELGTGPSAVTHGSTRFSKEHQGILAVWTNVLEPMCSPCSAFKTNMTGVFTGGIRYGSVRYTMCAYPHGSTFFKDTSVRALSGLPYLAARKLVCRPTVGTRQIYKFHKMITFV